LRDTIYHTIYQSLNPLSAMNSSWFWRLRPSIVRELDKPVFFKFRFVVDMTKLYWSFVAIFYIWSELSMLSVCIALHCMRTINTNCFANYIAFIWFNINLNFHVSNLIKLNLFSTLKHDLKFKPYIKTSSNYYFLLKLQKRS
jgi:hypothetical protein